MTVNAATSVTATFDLLPMTLSVTKSGTGSGTVTSNPAGISCGATCSQSVTPGTAMTLTATPAAGSSFAGWSGACSGTGTCAVTVNAATAVTATFNLVPVTLSVTKGGTGSGTVTSNPAGISCGATCSQSVTPGTAITLTATPAAGSSFAGWSGACSGTGTCAVTVNAATAVTATFNTNPTPVTLSVTKSGTGSGTVSGNPAGISCGATCSQSVTPGTAITLTATPDVGSSFAGWGGACSGTGTCAVTVNAATSVTAMFSSNPSLMMLSITKDGTGSGTVTSAPAGINCGASCSQPMAAGTAMTLTATPTSGSTFMGWSGACSGTGTCAVMVSSAIAVNATFDTDRVDRPLAPNPTPAISTLLPISTVAGGTGITLTVNGTGFVTTSVVRWNGANRTTTFVSRTQLQAAITQADLATSRVVPITVVSPTPGGGTSGAVSFSITAAPSTPPAAPAWPSVTTLGADTTGVSFAVAWAPVSGVASYRYSAAFSDGTAAQQGTVTTPSLQLRLPYHVSGAAASGFVCVASVNAAGQQSATFACNAVAVPARPNTPASTPTGPRRAGLVAAYSFNETSGATVTDLSGNNNTGTLGSTVARTAQGRFGGALLFNGDSFVTIPNSASLALTTGMTLEAWVFPTASTGLETALMKEQPGGLVYALYASSSASRPMVYFNTGPSTNRHRYLTGPAALPLNTWSHLAATYDGVTLRLYVNGAQVSSQPHTGSLVTSTGALRIGGDAVWGEYFRGMIDEVRIYNRALLPAEIVTDMGTGAGQ